MGCGCEKGKGDNLKPKRFNLPINQKREINKVREKPVSMTRLEASRSANRKRSYKEIVEMDLNERNHKKEVSTNLERSIHRKNHFNRLREQMLRNKQ